MKTYEVEVILKAKAYVTVRAESDKEANKLAVRAVELADVNEWDTQSTEIMSIVED